MGEEVSLRDRVFRELLLHPDYGPSEMAKHLNANYNSVKAVYGKLCAEGFLVREGRGKYTLNIPRMILDLYERLKRLEG